MSLLGKIVSGGQTGVDRGAIEAALALDFPYGGLIPKGRLAEDGQVPDKFDKMEVSTKKDYLFRTEWNVTHSDATLIISNYNTSPGAKRESLTGGTLRTEQFCLKHKKPHLVIFTQNADRVFDWLKSLGKNEIVLNVAGPRESKANGIEERTRYFIVLLLARVYAGADGLCEIHDSDINGVSPEIPPVTFEEYRRQRGLRILSHEDTYCSLDDILSGIEELKQSKIAYFKKFKGAHLPHYQRDVNIIKRQIAYGKPFKPDDATKCEWCSHMSLDLSKDKTKVRYKCERINFADCPDSTLSAFNYHWGMTLLETKFIRMGRWLARKESECRQSKNWVLLDKISSLWSKFHNLRQYYNDVWDVCSLIHAPEDWQILARKDVQETDSIPALTTTP